jgi:hypothetical protein
VSAVAALAADLTITMIHMATGLDGGTAVEIDNKGYFGIFAGYILLNAVINGLGLRVLTFMTQARGRGPGAGPEPRLGVGARARALARPWALAWARAPSSCSPNAAAKPSGAIIQALATAPPLPRPTGRPS